jgi:hypothetical protein
MTYDPSPSPAIPPAISRVYDAASGGLSTTASDRTLLDRVLAIMPGYRYFARANRAFTHRAVHAFLDAGITQILDLGCGILTPDSTHEIARTAPADGGGTHTADVARADVVHAEVVYVDTDPTVIEHVRAGTAGTEHVRVVEADLCRVDELLDHPVCREVLDLTRPVGVLAAAVLHCLPGHPNSRTGTGTGMDHSAADDPADVLRRYFDRLPAGSMLAMSHASGDTLDAAVTADAIALFADAGITVVSRTRSEIEHLLGPWDTTPDGVTRLVWSPPPGRDPHDALGYTAIATKPADIAAPIAAPAATDERTGRT